MEAGEGVKEGAGKGGGVVAGAAGDGVDGNNIKLFFSREDRIKERHNISTFFVVNLQLSFNRTL